MDIVQTTITLFYPTVSQIGRKIFKFEDMLSKYYGPFQLLPVPEEAPEEIPRITAVSRNGHSQLIIAPSKLLFVTQYDDNFNRNWEKCLEYLNSGIDRLINILSDEISYYSFSGLTTQLMFDNYDQPLDALSKFINLKSKPDPFDINIKLTFAIKDIHYANIAISNTRSINPNELEPGCLINTNQRLGIILDVNDRYGFNFIKGYKSDAKALKNNIDITNEIVVNKLSMLIEEGVIEL